MQSQERAMITLVAGFLVLAAATVEAGELTDAHAILESYVSDFQHDPAAAEPITFGIRITGDGGGDWHVVNTGKKSPGSADFEVSLRSGFPKEPCAFFILDLATLQKIDDGSWNALTAMGRAHPNDVTPMDIKTTDGFQPDAKFFGRIVPFSFHFWTRGWPERVPYGPGKTRVIHGANACIFYYQQGLRSAWFQIEKGQHANQDPSEQITPFPSMLIGLKGRCEAKIDGKTITLDKSEMLFIPAGVAHEFWNPYDEPAEAILLMFGEGA